MEWCTEEDRAKIEEVGFEWDEFGDGFKWNDVVAGLTHYKTLYGELPEDDFQVKRREEKRRETHVSMLQAFPGGVGRVVSCDLIACVPFFFVFFGGICMRCMRTQD